MYLLKLSDIIKEILKLLVNILSNRGFEQVQPNQKSMFSRFIQRTIQLTKHYRENYAAEDDIISKLTQFTTIFLSNAQLKTLILGEFNKIDMIRSLLNDIQVNIPHKYHIICVITRVSTRLGPHFFKSLLSCPEGFTKTSFI